jgi:PAS domain S-box-containing protein
MPAVITKTSTPFAWATIVVAVLGPLAGLAAERAWHRSDDRKALERFTEEVAGTGRTVESEVAEGGRTVAAAAALLSTREATTSREFTRFALELMAQGSPLQALSWAPLVPLPERRPFEAEARRDTGARYTITERSKSGALVPAAARARYFPVRFIEPMAGNQAALGFDLGSDPVRLEALSRSAESGQVTITGLVRLIQEDGQSNGFLLVVPVFRAAAEENQARTLSGFATGVVRVEDLLFAALPGRDAGGSRDMVVELVDHDGVNGKGVSLEHPRQESGTLAAGTAVRLAVDLEGRPWTLIAHPTSAYLARQAHSRATVIGFGVFLSYEVLLLLALTTRRWWFERARREQAEFADSVIRSVSEGVMVADASGKFSIINAAARRVLGGGRLNLPLAEWSRTFGLFVPGTNRHFPADELPLPRAMRGEHVPETEVFVRNAQVPGGAWTSVTGSPLKDVAGQLIGGVVVFRDVTEQKRAHEVAQRLSNAVEQTADCVFITDRAGIIEYVNPAFESTTGYSRSEAIGRTPAVLKSGLQRPEYYATLWATITRGEPFNGTVINRKRSGEHFYAEQTITPMRDASTGEITHFVSVMRDTTERIKLRERDFEMRLGSAVQKRLFPQGPLVVPGYDIAGRVAPASATCGDYFDFIPLPDGRLALGIADVSGHGVGSALIMTAMRAYLRSLAATLASIDSLAGELNRLLLADLEEQRFVTMILAVLETASGTLKWANFGHPTGYVLDRSGTVKAELKSGCRPLGLFPDLICAEGPGIVLEPGDALVLLTDGILEAMSPEGREFGHGGVQEVLRSLCDRPADVVAARLIAEAQLFARERVQDDDLTVVVCRRLVS